MNLADRIVYADGRFCRYDEARVGLLSHGLQYGTGCFEGVRGFWNAADRELYLLHLREHFERHADSARVLMIGMPHSVDELAAIAVELCARNRFEENVYVRPVAFKNGEDIGVRLQGVPDAYAMIAIPFSKYFDAEAGLKVGTSSWRRIDDTIIPARAKVTGAYINSALAKTEAQLNGFDEAIMLSHDGHVSEASAANLFMVRDRTFITPDASQNILEGITRRALMTLIAGELQLPVVERTVDRTELYVADELFLCGSGAGIMPVISVDHRPVGTGTMGPLTRQLAAIYDRIVCGREPKYRSWLTPAYATAGAGVA